VRRERHHLQIEAVTEETGIDDGVRDARKRGELKMALPKHRQPKDGNNDTDEAKLPRPCLSRTGKLPAGGTRSAH